MARDKRHVLHLLCFLAAFHPNCMRSCPTGILSCTCKWDWEECPPPPSCSGSSTGALSYGDSGAVVIAYPDGGSIVRARDASIIAYRNSDEARGTMAFAVTPSGTFLVASIAAADVVRVVRVDVTASEGHPLAARVVGDVSLGHGDEPGRIVVDDEGLAHVVLRNAGAVVTIDPTSLAIVGRLRTCASPRGLALDRDGRSWVACNSGDVIGFDRAGEETKRTFVDRGLIDLATTGDTIIATTPSRLFVLRSDGTLATHDDGRPIRAIAATDSSSVAIAHRNGVELAPLDGTSGSTLGSWTSVTDIATDDDSTIAVAANGGAFVLSPSATSFSPIASPGFATSVALVTVNGSRHVLALQTSEATLAFMTIADPTDVVVVE